MAETSLTTATDTAATQLPAVIGNYKIAKVDPAKLGELVKANIAGGISAFDLDRIKVPSGGGITWMVPSLDGEKAEAEVSGVIVAWSDQRAYWQQEFSGAGTPPDCASRDSLTGIGSPGGNCQRCAFAQFGSAVKNGEQQAGQACKQMRLLFLIREGDALPVVIACPPTSLQAIRKYFLRLSGQMVPYYGAVTRFRLAQDKNAKGIKYSKVEPFFAAQLADDEAQRIKLYSESIQGVLKTVEATAADYQQV